jgi:hypothetical protein
LGLAPPRRTSNKVAQRFSVRGKLKSLSDIDTKIGCILIFLWFSEIDLDLPNGRLKNLDPFFSDGRPTKSLPMNCKLSNRIDSYSLLPNRRTQEGIRNQIYTVATYTVGEEKENSK